MRKLLFILALLVTPSAWAQVSISANLKDLGTANATSQSTRVEFKLEGFSGQIPRVTGTGTIVTQLKVFRPNSSGIISGSVWSNSQITPSGTYYRVCVFDAGQLFRCNSYNITATFDLNNATPISTTPSATVNTVVTQSYSQSFTSLTTWTVTHNFADPSTVCHFFDTLGNEFNPDLWTRTNNNMATALFVVATSGSATCFRAGQFALTQGSLALNDVVVKAPSGTQTVLGDFVLALGGSLTAGRVNSIRYVDGTRFALTRAGIQDAINDLPARGGIVVIPTPFVLDATTLTVGSNGTGDPRTTGKSVLLVFANMGVWSGTANPMFTLADRSGVIGLGRSTYLQNTGASGARIIDIAHAAEHVIIRDLGLVSKGPAIKGQGSIPGAKWSNLFVQVDSGSGIETQMWNDTAEASGIFINHTSATGSCWRNGVTGTGGGLEWGQNNAAIRDLTCQMSTVGAGPGLHWESDGGTQNTYGTGIIENVQFLSARKEAIKVVGFGTGPFNIRNVKIGTPTLDAGTWDAITVTGSPSALTGVTLDGISGGTLTAYRYTVNWASSGAGNQIRKVNAVAGTATLNVSGGFILEDIAGVIENGIRATFFSASATAAATGGLRLGNSGFVAARNAGNTADIKIGEVDGANFVNIGSGSSGITLLHSAGATNAVVLSAGTRLAYSVGTALCDAATFDVSGTGNVTTCTPGGANTITTLSNGRSGQPFTIICGNANLTLANGATIKLSGAVNFVCTAEDTISLVYDGTTWREIGRSVN